LRFDGYGRYHHSNTGLLCVTHGACVFYAHDANGRAGKGNPGESRSEGGQEAHERNQATKTAATTEEMTTNDKE
jgi:hypothetical protein